MKCDYCGWVFNKFCDECIKRLEEENRLVSFKSLEYNKDRKENNGNKTRKKRR